MEKYQGFVRSYQLEWRRTCRMPVSILMFSICISLVNNTVFRVRCKHAYHPHHQNSYMDCTNDITYTHKYVIDRRNRNMHWIFIQMHEKYPQLHENSISIHSWCEHANLVLENKFYFVQPDNDKLKIILYNTDE